jgi:hypothetical protein
VRVVQRRATEVLAHGIEPDVPGYGFGRVGMAEDAVVVFGLPERAVSALGEGKSGLLFVALDEGCEVAGVGCGAEQGVQVIRHDAVSVDKEGSVCGVRSKAFGKPGSKMRIFAEGPAVGETEGEEVHFAAVVVGGEKTDVFAEEG